MSTNPIFSSFIKTAVLDLEAAKVLANNKHHAQSLFYLEQSFEKSIKALYAFYMKRFEELDGNGIEKKLKDFSHDNYEALIVLFRHFLEKYDIAYGSKSTAEMNLLNDGKDLLNRHKDPDLDEQKLIFK